MAVPRDVRAAQQLLELERLRSAKTATALAATSLLIRLRYPDPKDPTELETAVITAFRTKFSDLADSWASYQDSPSCRCSSTIRAELVKRPAEVQAVLDEVYGPVYKFVPDSGTVSDARSGTSIIGRSYTIEASGSAYEAVFKELRAQYKAQNLQNHFHGVHVKDVPATEGDTAKWVLLFY